MNNKKSKLLRKLAKINVSEKEQPFKLLRTRKFKKQFLLQNGKTTELECQSVVLDRTCGAFIYRQMKKSYKDMKILYRGMKSHKV